MSVNSAVEPTISARVGVVPPAELERWCFVMSTYPLTVLSDPPSDRFTVYRSLVRLYFTYKLTCILLDHDIHNEIELELTR